MAKEVESKVSVNSHIVPRIKDIIIDTFVSVKSQTNPTRRKNHFELLGYDFLIDEDFRVWLIEVNSNPYLGSPCAWAKKVLPMMADEML